MARKRKEEDTQAKLTEVLSSQVDPTGVGEDPVVREFLTRIASATPTEALEIMDAMQKHLLNVEEKRETIIHLRGRAADIEAAEKAWEDDRERFVNDLFDRNPPPTGEEAEKIKARGIKKYEAAMRRHGAKRAARQLAFDKRVQTDPKVDIMVTGHTEVINDEVKLVPDVLKIMHRTFVFPPGKHTVPKIIADAYENLQAHRAEAELRKEMMSAADGSGMEFQKFRAAQMEIDAKLGRRSDFSGGY